MLWEDKRPETPPAGDGELIDISYAISCRCVPLDHAWDLSNAVLAALPWLADDERAGIHLIHGAESGNGWMRPEDVEHEVLHLSRRARMELRIPAERAGDGRALTGSVLDVRGHRIEVGAAKLKPLSHTGTLFARHVATTEGETEEAFLERVIAEVRALDIELHKILCGRRHVFATPDGPLHTQSVMVADLTPAESIRLQHAGVGPHRKMGCGLFIPHKGIDPVRTGNED